MNNRILISMGSIPRSLLRCERTTEPVIPRSLLRGDLFESGSEKIAGMVFAHIEVSLGAVPSVTLQYKIAE